jgi:hypothetical protein
MNKLVGARFLVHGIVNHILLRQRGFDLAKPKLALSIGAFYSHTLVWLSKVIERMGLGTRLNLQVF